MAAKHKFQKKSPAKLCIDSSNSRPQGVKSPLSKPTYICKSCERSASSPDVLCDPEKLFTSW